MKKNSLTITLILFTFWGYSQTREANDTLRNKLILGMAFRMPMFDFSIQDSDEKGRYIDYSANVPLSLGASIHYKSFGISYSQEMDNSEDDSKYGKTKYTDIQLYYHQKKIGYELYYQKYKGYYLEDSKKFGFENSDSNTIRPDIKTQNIGFNIIYVFSKKYSTQTLFNQSTNQKKLNWTFLMMGSFNQLRLNSNRNLIPDTEAIFYGENNSFRGGTYNVVAISPGLAIIAPFHNFYISSALITGYGFSQSNNQYLNENKKSGEAFIKINLKFGAGYNGKRIFTGMATSLDSLVPMKSGDEVEFQTFSGFVEFFLNVKF